MGLFRSESGSESRVTAFTFDKTSGKLTQLNAQVTDADPCHIAIDKTNRLLRLQIIVGSPNNILRGEEGDLILPIFGVLKDTGWIPFVKRNSSTYTIFL